MIKYKIRPGVWPGMKIEVVEVQRETEKSVWVSVGSANTVQLGKSTGYHEYHDTWKQAHGSLLEHANVTLNNARRTLEKAQGLYGNVKGMREPV